MTESVQIIFSVPDMSCGHCAAAVKQALEEGIKGAKAEADSGSKAVRLTAPRPVSHAEIAALITEAGYEAKFA